MNMVSFTMVAPRLRRSSSEAGKDFEDPTQKTPPRAAIFEEMGELGAQFYLFVSEMQ
jgi:hypothetical protein